ncbi:hypothetical protein Tco_0503227 [Tanacetum coccineum]
MHRMERNKGQQCEPSEGKYNLRALTAKPQANQDSLNSAAGGNLLERSTKDALTIIENKSKVQNSQNRPVVAKLPFNAVEECYVTCGGQSLTTSVVPLRATLSP